MEKWEMYMEIHQLKKQGFKVRRIARKLRVSRTTVYKYLEKSPEEMSLWMASTKSRKKKLDPYEMIIHTWLTEHPDMSAAQIHDWLLEKYKDLKVGESTVRGYVKELREKYSIPKEEEKRIYQAVPELPMGQQAQVDFGQTNQKKSDGTSVKLNFITFVLSHSRYKYVEWLDRPFTTKDAIRCHENAFRYFGGIPNELVYDQDSLLIVSENSGDLILTAEFQSYREERKLNFTICRKADPESKGKIENVVGYIKGNFAKNRVFDHIDTWNEQTLAWLDRTGNKKVHNTTKKRPVEVFSLEKQHLRPIIKKITISNINSSITRTVRKDNTIVYLSNRYSVPLGTYKKGKSVFIEATDEGYLLIRDEKDGPTIAEHKISHQKGKLIQDTQHTRDRTKGIPAYITSIAEKFKNQELAHSYLKEIHRRYPRYIRDQLQLIGKEIKSDPELIDEVLEMCINKGIYSATEFSDIVQYVKRQSQVDKDAPIVESNIVQLTDADKLTISTKPHTRNLDSYLEVLEGVSK
ncbi:Integrase, catalytic region [Bacillus thermotolerans]|nr:Integrase, catalytic region [Bacillus thermotolerans]